MFDNFHTEGHQIVGQKKGQLLEALASSVDKRRQHPGLLEGLRAEVLIRPFSRGLWVLRNAYSMLTSLDP